MRIIIKNIFRYGVGVLCVLSALLVWFPFLLFIIKPYVVWDSVWIMASVAILCTIWSFLKKDHCLIEICLVADIIIIVRYVFI
jgi:hypothetical protein